MNATTLNERKNWYVEAKGSLVINHGLSGKDTEQAISDYRLQERLDLYPSQMHFDTDDIADEIFQYCEF